MKYKSFTVSSSVSESDLLSAGDLFLMSVLSAIFVELATTLFVTVLSFSFSSCKL